MDTEELNAIQTRRQAITGTPWAVYDSQDDDYPALVVCEDRHMVLYMDCADGSACTAPELAFIAHAPDDIGALLAEVARCHRLLGVAEVDG